LVGYQLVPLTIMTLFGWRI